MRPGRAATTFAALLSLAAGAIAPALADARVEQNTRIEFGGVLGSMYRTLGGKTAREGLVSLDALRGERLLSKTEKSGELIDLGEEKVYSIDFDRRRYTVKTFAQIRQEFEEAMKEAKARQADAAGQEPPEPPSEAPPEYEWDVDLVETGKKETISGYDTRQVVLTVIGHPKGQKLEEGGGVVVTLDQWLGPELPQMAELAAFHMRYAEALGLHEMLRGEIQQMAALLAANPQFGEALEKLQEKRVDMKGAAIRSALTLESVPSKEQEEARTQEEDQPPTSIGGVLGGLGKKLGKKAQPSGQGGSPGRTMAFRSTTTLLSAGASVAEGEVTIPVGFKAVGGQD